MSSPEIFDLETFVGNVNVPVPQMVCCAYEDRILVPWEGESPYKLFERLILGPECITNHNIEGFDLAVVAVECPHLFVPIWEKLKAGLVRCTQIREQLYRIAKGEARYVDEDEEEESEGVVTRKTEFSLQATAWRWLKIKVEKEDTYRLKYGTLYRVPLKDWPADARTYPVNDVTITRQVDVKQRAAIRAEFGVDEMPDEHARNLRAWSLKLMSCWGIRTHREYVERLKKDLTKREAEGIAELVPHDIYRIGGTKKAPKYVRTTQVIRDRVISAYAGLSEAVPLTKKGQVSTSRKTKVESGDPILYRLAEVEKVSKIKSAFIPVLESGTEYPISAGYKPLVASGRGACVKPNWQQLPKWPGVRECVVARPGRVFAVADFEMAELCSMAQVFLDMVGFSVLAEQINAGKKPIMAFAAKLAGMSYEEAMEEYKKDSKHSFIAKMRQDSKAAMYGIPGIMRAKKLAFTANAQGNPMTVQRAEQLIREYEHEYLEFPRYVQLVKSYVGYDFGDRGTVVQLRSNRIRGGCTLPEACNTYFQGLMGDAAMEAQYNVTEECFLDRSSALYGSRPVWFVHDELACEVPEDRASEAAERMAHVMVSTARKWLPDVKIEAEPVLMYKWSKEAKAKKIDGKLVPWDERPN
jgi:DNA polymerase I-like protein with 3'-5' exonuclease and polymerase domains